jgi:hypothetical protein
MELWESAANLFRRLSRVVLRNSRSNWVSWSGPGCGMVGCKEVYSRNGCALLFFQVSAGNPAFLRNLDWLAILLKFGIAP